MDKDYFVITTNVGHCFQKAGFDKKRLYYTQGDYGLFQCSEPCHDDTYNNEKIIRRMVTEQGWQIGADDRLYLPDGVTAKMSVSDEQIPRCPKEIEAQSICIDEDIGKILSCLLN